MKSPGNSHQRNLGCSPTNSLQFSFQTRSRKETEQHSKLWKAVGSGIGSRARPCLIYHLLIKYPKLKH